MYSPRPQSRPCRVRGGRDGVQDAVPFAPQQRAGLQEPGVWDRHWGARLATGRSDPLEVTDRRWVEVAQCIGLDAIGEKPEQKVLGHMRRGLAPGQSPPANAQAIKVEIAQARDLRFEGRGPGLVERHQAALSLAVEEPGLTMR